eukprot:536601_1
MAEVLLEEVITHIAPNVLPELIPFIKPAVRFLKSYNITTHPQKMQNISNFVTTINEIDLKSENAVNKMIQGVNDHFNAYWELSYAVSEENPLSSLATYQETPQQAHQICMSVIQKESAKMMISNVQAQAIIIVAEFALIVQLGLQAHLAHTTLKEIENNLSKIKNDYLIPAYKLIYVDINKHAIMKQNMTCYELNVAEIYLKSAYDLLQRDIATLNRQKTSSLYNTITGCVAVIGGAAVGVAWYLGLSSLARANVSAVGGNMAKFTTQQQICTKAQGVMTVGIFSVTVAHAWNYAKCCKVLQTANEVKKEIDHERTKLKLWIAMLSREK